MNDQQFNVTLQTLLRRTQGILQLLDTIIKRRGYTWPEVLEQYAVLSTHYFRLCDELNEALYHFVLFPRQLPPDVTWVPELLRTKLLPEQEKDMLALLTALNAAEAASSSAAASTSAEPLNFDESLGHRVANHNASLTEVSTEFERLLDSSVRKGRTKLRPAPLPNAPAINQCCATLLLGTNAASVDEAMRQRAALKHR